MTLMSITDLNDLWSSRAMHYGNDHAAMDRMVDVYFGGIPEEYSDFFHEDTHIHLVNNIRLAWDDLAWLAGKEFPIYVEPDSQKSKAKQRAEKLEKIAYGWNNAARMSGGVSMKGLMKVLMWWLVGTANAVVMTLPDYHNKTPMFTFRDPRSHYPPVGWTPWNQTQAEDALFVYQKSLMQLKIEYPERRDEISQALKRNYSLGPGGGRSVKDEDDIHVWVGEYYHADCWAVGVISDANTHALTLARSDTGDRGHPGVQPVVASGLYSPAGAKGRSLFADQISIQAAMARMFSQKLDYFDRTLYPLIFTTPLAGKTVKVGPYAVNEFDITSGQAPRLDSVGPTNAIDADQTMQFALGLSRMLNRNPEQMQGIGDADSAKALSELRKGVTDTIREGIWPAMVEVLPTLYARAAQMDVALWPNQTKSLTGKRKNQAFRISYRPMTDLKNREWSFDIEPGVGLAGYQGTLEILQLVGAELMSEDTALEQGEWAREPQEEKRKIQGNRSEKLMWADLGAKAAGGLLKSGAIAKLRRMTQEGEDLFDAIEALEDQGQLYMTPEQPDPMAELLGGGAAPPGGDPLGGLLPPPSLSALRGGGP